MNPEENQNPVAEEPQDTLVPEPTSEAVVEDPKVASVEVQPGEVKPETPVEEAVKPEEPKEVSMEAEAPISFNWKKPIIWMVVIGVVTLGIWLVANTI